MNINSVITRPSHGDVVLLPPDTDTEKVDPSTATLEVGDASVRFASLVWVHTVTHPSTHKLNGTGLRLHGWRAPDRDCGGVAGRGQGTT